MPPGPSISEARQRLRPGEHLLTYRLSGSDAASFTVDSASGQLRTRPGVTYDFETKSRYSVTVEAEDEQGGRATVTVTVELTKASGRTHPTSRRSRPRP